MKKVQITIKDFFGSSMESMYKDDKELVNIFQEILNEIERSKKKHKESFSSNHEWYGVLQEEFDELWDEIKKVKGCYVGTEEMKKEAIHVAAMAIKGILSLCNKKS